MIDDPLDPVFGKTEELEGENRVKLANLLIGFVKIDADKGTIQYNPAGEALSTLRKVLVFLLARLALSTRNPDYQAAVTPKTIEAGTGLPGGTVRPKLTELVKIRVVFQDDLGKYFIRVSAISRAESILEDALSKLK